MLSAQGPGTSSSDDDTSDDAFENSGQAYDADIDELYGMSEIDDESSADNEENEQ